MPNAAALYNWAKCDSSSSKNNNNTANVGQPELTRPDNNSRGRELQRWQTNMSGPPLLSGQYGDKADIITNFFRVYVFVRVDATVLCSCCCCCMCWFCCHFLSWHLFVIFYSGEYDKMATTATVTTTMRYHIRKIKFINLCVRVCVWEPKKPQIVGQWFLSADKIVEAFRGSDQISSILIRIFLNKTH